MSEYLRQVFLDVGLAGVTGKRFEGFRVAFRVDMTREPTPNTAEIRFYNPNPETIGTLQNPDAVVRLYAGYDAPLMIFQGNPTKGGVRQEKQGPDRILFISAEDGGAALRTARVDASFATETTMSQVLATLIPLLEAQGVTAGVATLGDAGGIRLTQGVTIHGPVRDVLTRLCLSAGLEWFVRDGQLVIATPDESTGEPAVVFSATTGNLIGSPSPKDDGIEARALLAPSLRPGHPFRVEGSGTLDGDYSSDRVIFTGDSGWEEDFYVTATGKRRAA